jgi:hypothetical protein
MLSKNFYFRFNYLLEKKANIKVILAFTLNSILHPFLSRKKKKLKKKHQKYLLKKKLTTDYFSINAYYWGNILKKFSKISYLEIGSFEGNSALYVLKNFQTKKVICVDIWHDKNEPELQEREFKNFKYNLKEFNKRYSMFKGTSDNFFKKNNNNFDIIYVDGSHESKQVYKDLNNSWYILNNNGILICDDYFYGNIYKKPKNVPADAINKFISEKINIKILCVNNSQIFLKKINS